MKKLLLAIALIAVFSSANKHAIRSKDARTGFLPATAKVIVYRTADSTNYRLTLTDTLQFSDFGQPLESSGLDERQQRHASWRKAKTRIPSDLGELFCKIYQEL